MAKALIPSVSGVPLGLSARGSVKVMSGTNVTRIIFRVRRGNGFYGSLPTVRYQDCFTDYTHVYSNTPAQNAQTAKYMPGVNAWKALSESEKQTWRDKAALTGHLTGYHLFMSDYLLTH